MANLIVNAQGEPTGTAGLIRTHLVQFNTGWGFQCKLMDPSKYFIVNVQGNPVQTLSGTNPFCHCHGGTVPSGVPQRPGVASWFNLEMSAAPVGWP